MIIDPLNADDAELLRNLKDDNDLLHALGELPTGQSEEDEPPLTDRQFHVLTELYRNARLFGFPEGTRPPIGDGRVRTAPHSGGAGRAGRNRNGARW